MRSLASVGVGAGLVRRVLRLTAWGFSLYHLGVIFEENRGYTQMAIDFTMSPQVLEVRDRIRAFINEEIEPAERELRKTQRWREGIIELRKKARARGLWCPHMPPEFGGMGLGPMAMAMVSAECGRSRLASFILNAQAPDEGNMHTMLHFATPEQKEKYLRPLCDGKIRSCFAMTEPEAAGSDPTQIKTHAEKSGDNWVINGHKWFISGAHGAKFAIVIAKTDPDADPPQARNSAFIVELPNRGLPDRARHRHHGGQGQSLRDQARQLRGPGRLRCSAGAARATSSGRCGWGRRAWRTACAGSETRKSRSR